MNRYHLLVATLGAALVAGCASTDKQAAVDDDDRTYVTGSRLPKHVGGHVKAITNKQGIDDLLRKGGSSTGGVTGAGGS
jgi:hypothetical protein